jgi:hypothetical protein
VKGSRTPGGHVTGYIVNVVDLLTATAMQLHLLVIARMVVEVMDDAATGRANADVLAVAAGDPARLPSLGPEEWL